jgi:hypothetical protein
LRNPGIQHLLVGAILLASLATAPVAGPVVETSTADNSETRSGAYRLSYQIPSGWASDHELARKRELTALLLPGGKTYRDADAMILIAFEGKHRNRPSPQTLQQYFYSEMGKLLRMFPEMTSIEWRPDSLDEIDVEVASLEVYVARRGPMRLVMMDVGDGYYSISLGVKEHQIFDRADIKDFFSSLELLPL